MTCRSGQATNVSINNKKQKQQEEALDATLVDKKNNKIYTALFHIRRLQVFFLNTK